MSRTVGGLTVEQRRETRRQKVLDAALELFATKGYLDSPIELLCQTAKVSTKSFYEAFESREACYLGLMERSTAHLQDSVISTLQRLDDADDEVSLAGALLQALAQTVVADPRHAIILFGHGSATTPTVEQRRRTNRRWAATFISDVWARTVSDPEAIPHGVVVGVTGGIFDIIADWVADLDAGAATDGDGLHRRLVEFYATVRGGLEDSRFGKEILSKLL